ncbi:MAG TPA: NUDIX hydrolase [Gammaproteobacteria bacterium]|nr:NUDIX hydrolase [Gammaproteobacteria bacterium]
MNDRDFTPHLTVAAVAKDADRYLVVREYIQGVEKINNPAGHIEDGESPIDAVIREVREETGYRFVPRSLGGVYLWRKPENGETFLRINVIGHCPEHDPHAPLDDGIIGPDWLTLEQLKSPGTPLRSPLVVRSFEEHRAGIDYPLDVISTLIDL